jgi:sporulation protein YlmC with PRC-barrel domain
MAHYGILHDIKFEDAEDIRGAEVYGVNDEKLGKIDDVIFDHSTGDIHYLVVDTGGWLTSKKFLVPANRIQPYGHHEDKFYAELDKERIQMLPEYDEKRLSSQEGWSDYEKQYEDRWKEGTVMYNERTNRVITPPADQVKGARKSALSEQGRQSLQRDFTPEKVGQRDDLLGVASGGDDVTLRPKKPSIAGREDAIMAEREEQQRRQSRVSSRVPDKSATFKESSHTPTVSSGAGESVPGPDAEVLNEPRVYHVEGRPDAPVETQSREPAADTSGPRYLNFQKKLRQHRDRVVGNCPLCGSQEKVA